MRLLARLLGLSRCRRSSRATPAVASGTHVAGLEMAGPPDLDVAAISAATLDLLAAETASSAAKYLIGALARPPRTQEAAAALLRSAAVPVLAACAAHGDASAACTLELIVYDRLIKAFESPEHYEACFGQFDHHMHAVGAARALRASRPMRSEGCTKLLFYFHYMAADLAHVVLFSDVISTYVERHPEEAANIGVVGMTGDEPAPCLVKLHERHGIPIYVIPVVPALGQYETAIKALESGGYDRLVVVATPVGLGYFTGRLVADQLAWWSMKFEINSFEHLRVRCSFVSGYRRTRAVNGRLWLEAPPMLGVKGELNPSPNPPPALIEARRMGTVFYTVNREEKIKNPLFLDMVARILNAVPQSCFLWTGRTAPHGVVEFFNQRGLAHRQVFVGWIKPDDLLCSGDIFLDTPVLSGTVAARAALAGRPVVTLAESHSWVNFFLPAYERERGSLVAESLDAAVSAAQTLGMSLEAVDADAYVALAVRLARDGEARACYANALCAFGQRYFTGSAQAAEDHIANLRTPTAAIIPAP